MEGSERSTQRPAGSALERPEPSAPGDGVRDPAVARPDEEAVPEAFSLAIGEPGVSSQAREDEEEEEQHHQLEEVTVVASSSAGNEEEAEVLEAAARLKISEAEAVHPRFVPIKDVKAMLQTGQFEGWAICYYVKKERRRLLNGVIHGTSYFCTCEATCDQHGKALSARGFEQHAVKGNDHETHNSNNHIVFGLSTVSLFEACRMLKDATSKDMKNKIFGKINENVMGEGKTGANNCKPENAEEGIDMGKGKIGTSNCKAENAEEMMDLMEKKMKEMGNRIEGLEKLQSQVNMLETSVDVLCNELSRYQKLFVEMSVILGKFGSE